MKKKPLIDRLYLKYSDRAAYKLYKQELRDSRNREIAVVLSNSGSITTLSNIIGLANERGQLSFNHSGNAGDIIYALPVLKRIHELTNVPVNLYLKLNQPLGLLPGRSHPLGSVMLNEKMVQMILPLIESQDYINLCAVENGKPVDIDLDHFRKGLVPQDRGNIAHWCSYFTGVNPQLWKSWITVKADNTYNNYIVVARSERYRNEVVNYSFLAGYDNIKFIGVESEFRDIQQYVPNIQWVQVKNFLQMAQVIAGSNLFIGNQSFPYAVAEALKVKRILELSFEVINVIPEGENGYDFIFQEHFEDLVQRLAKD